MIRALFGIIALVPAALNAAPAHATTLGQMLTVPLCEGGVAHGAVSVPLGRRLPATEPTGCCAKGCHGSRKRTGGKPGTPPIDPAQ